MEELGVWKNLYLVANSWKVTALKQGPLSEITVSGIPWVANSSLAAVITLFAVLHCEKFDFNPSGVVVNSDKVCSSSILKQIHANPLPMAAGKR